MRREGGWGQQEDHRKGKMREHKVGWKKEVMENWQMY
jgi:hypothetical protein